MLNFDLDKWHFARLDLCYAPTEWDPDHDPQERHGLFMTRGTQTMRLMWHSVDASEASMIVTMTEVDGEWVYNEYDSTSLQKAAEFEHERIKMAEQAAAPGMVGTITPDHPLFSQLAQMLGDPRAIEAAEAAKKEDDEEDEPGGMYL